MVLNDYFVCYAKSATILFKVKDVSFCYIWVQVDIIYIYIYICTYCVWLTSPSIMVSVLALSHTNLWFIRNHSMDIHVQLGDNCIVFGTFTASRFYRSNQKRYMEGQAIQWAMEKNQKGQTMIYKALHRRLEIEQNEPLKIIGNRCTNRNPPTCHKLNCFQFFFYIVDTEHD